MANSARIYLDYNATAPIAPEVMDVYISELKNDYANASSLHEDGRRASARIKDARASIAKLIGAAPGADIVFTSGGSESNNTVFYSMISAARRNGNKTILVSSIEHPCVLESARRLQKQGFTVYFLPVDGDGIVDTAVYAEYLERRPLLVSIMAANNETGTLQDIAGLCAQAHERGALFHTDAVQAVGKIPVDAAAWDVDFMTLSGHKLYGPKGVGALYVKKDAPYDPLIVGGHQENGRRAGTYNAPSVIAFGAAAARAARRLDGYSARVSKLRDRLRDGLLRGVPDIKINGHQEKTLPNTLNVSFPGAEGESILLHLDLLGVSVSTGSACASGSLEPSHVLGAIGLGPELAHGSIRFSLGEYTTEEEIDFVVKHMPDIIDRLRKYSTVYGSAEKGDSV